VLSEKDFNPIPLSKDVKFPNHLKFSLWFGEVVLGWCWGVFVGGGEWGYIV